MFFQRESKRGVGLVVFVLSKRIKERCRIVVFSLAKGIEERCTIRRLYSYKENQREVYNLLSLFQQRESKRGVGLVVFVLAKRIKERCSTLVFVLAKRIEEMSRKRRLCSCKEK